MVVFFCLMLLLQSRVPCRSLDLPITEWKMIVSLLPSPRVGKKYWTFMLLRCMLGALQMYRSVQLMPGSSALRDSANADVLLNAGRKSRHPNTEQLLAALPVLAVLLRFFFAGATSPAQAAGARERPGSNDARCEGGRLR
jgi:hypothetical protein